MRISPPLKTLLLPLLALLLVAGCVAPVPAPMPAATADGVTISVSLGAPGYATQNLKGDIKSLVFGLVDVAQNDAYFGYVNNGTTNASLPESGTPYHLAIAGNGNVGSGLLSGDGLEAGQWAQTKRYLYAIAPDASKLSMTFAGVRESASRRYVAFVAAFGKDAATLTSADLLGFARSATPFSIVNGNPSEPLTLTLTLDRGLATLPVFVNFTGTQFVPLASASKVVVALADMDPNRVPRFGDEGTSANAPGFHPEVAGTWSGAIFTKGYFDYPFDFPDTVGKSGEYNRFIYAVIPAGPGAVAGERSVLFSNLRPGGRYSVFAAALDAADALVGLPDQEDGITLQVGSNTPQRLELPLDQ
jgi:hypothetical protein